MITRVCGKPAEQVETKISDPFGLESLTLEEIREVKARLLEEHPELACLAQPRPRAPLAAVSRQGQAEGETLTPETGRRPGPLATYGAGHVGRAPRLSLRVRFAAVRR